MNRQSDYTEGLKLLPTQVGWYSDQREESTLRGHFMPRFALAMVAALLLFWTGTPISAQNKDKAKDKDKDQFAKEKDVLVGGKTLKQWVAELHQARDPGMRITAMQMLTHYGTAAQEAVPDLVEELKQRDPSLRTNAIVALGAIGSDKENVDKVLTAVAKLLGDNQQIVRYRAILLLAYWGPVAKKYAAPQLLSLVKDTYNSSWEVRRASALALGSIGQVPKDNKDQQDPHIFRALTDALSDPCAMVRLEALSALFMLGPPLTPTDRNRAIQSLTALTGNKDKTQAIWAHMVLVRFENKPAAPKNPDKNADKLSKSAEKHLHAIALYLKHQDLDVKIQAARALGMAGTNAKNEVPELMEALGDKELAVIAWSIAALKEIGPGAQKALPDLEDLTKHKNEGLQKLAKDAIDVIGGKDKGKRQVVKPVKDEP
jgi:HEAT repeat protein